MNDNPNNSTARAGNFPVVGLGASAGGLEALELFFKALPDETGMAFVLVVHLDPKHISLLPELLQKHTKMPVCQAEDNMQVKPNHLYVIPPNKCLSILNGALQLLDLVHPRGANLPIDIFLRALAQDQGRRGICIILSGTGTDGTLGARAIKSELGLVMAQDKKSAKYEGMPHSVIATDLVDYVLPPDHMPAQLIKYINHMAAGKTPRVDSTEGQTTNALNKIFVQLRAQTDHDFSLYKKNTICRRIERRMNVNQIDNIEDYVQYLQESDRETSVLFKELLIGVTNFFRDPPAFEILQSAIIPKLLDRKPDGRAVRVWVPGCATGEEAYSIAIILHECMEKSDHHFHIQIFGTDLDDSAINVARRGVYPDTIKVDVTPERLKRYFSEDSDGYYRVNKLIREMVVFAPHNVIKDPPFTKLDLLSCRNLLIYLGPQLQKALLPKFYYSLKPEGALFLGSSETIGQNTELFLPVDKKWKLFRRTGDFKNPDLELHFPTHHHQIGSGELTTPKSVQRAQEMNTLELVETILKQSGAPTCVVINDACNAVYIHGRTGQYLEPAVGKASVNLIEMARPGLKAELAAAIRRVSIDKQEVTVSEIRTEGPGGDFYASLTVCPVFAQSIKGGLMIVTFEESQAPSKTKKKAVVGKPKSRTAKELERDLQDTKNNLQETIEEFETSNEELKSTNEELQSTNEELQSTNEELETSKEELQSLNEESITINAELQARIDELSKTNDDMKNLLDSTDIATIFLDSRLQIRRFTPRATDIMPLTASDYGRPISHLASQLVDVDLMAYGQKVLSDLAICEVEVTGKHDRIYDMRIRPYRTIANVIDGVVITFENITRRKAIETELEKKETTLLHALKAGQLGAFEVDLESGKGQWTRGLAEIWGIPHELDGNFADLCWSLIHAEDLERVNADFAQIVESGQVGDIEFRIKRSDGEVRWIHWRGQVTPTGVNQSPIASGVNQDITEIKRIQQDLAWEQKRLLLVSELVGDGLFETSAAGEFVYVNSAFTAAFGFALDDLVGKKWHDVIHPDARLDTMTLKQQFDLNKTIEGKSLGVCKNGDRQNIQYRAQALMRGKVLAGFIGSTKAITPEE